MPLYADDPAAPGRGLIRGCAVLCIRRAARGSSRGFARPLDGFDHAIRRARGNAQAASWLANRLVMRAVHGRGVGPDGGDIRLKRRRDLEQAPVLEWLDAHRMERLARLFRRVVIDGSAQLAWNV